MHYNEHCAWLFTNWPLKGHYNGSALNYIACIVMLRSDLADQSNSFFYLMDNMGLSTLLLLNMCIQYICSPL